MGSWRNPNRVRAEKSRADREIRIFYKEHGCGRPDAMDRLRKIFSVALLEDNQWLAGDHAGAGTGAINDADEYAGSRIIPDTFSSCSKYGGRFQEAVRKEAVAAYRVAGESILAAAIDRVFNRGMVGDNDLGKERKGSGLTGGKTLMGKNLTVYKDPCGRSEDLIIEIDIPERDWKRRGGKGAGGKGDRGTRARDFDHQTLVLLGGEARSCVAVVLKDRKKPGQEQAVGGGKQQEQAVGGGKGKGGKGGKGAGSDHMITVTLYTRVPKEALVDLEGEADDSAEADEDDEMGSENDDVDMVDPILGGRNQSGGGNPSHNAVFDSFGISHLLSQWLAGIGSDPANDESVPSRTKDVEPVSGAKADSARGAGPASGADPTGDESAAAPAQTKDANPASESAEAAPAQSKDANPASGAGPGCGESAAISTPAPTPAAPTSLHSEDATPIRFRLTAIPDSCMISYIRMFRSAVEIENAGEEDDDERGISTKFLSGLRVGQSQPLSDTDDEDHSSFLFLENKDCARAEDVAKYRTAARCERAAIAADEIAADEAVWALKKAAECEANLERKKTEEEGVLEEQGQKEEMQKAEKDIAERKSKVKQTKQNIQKFERLCREAVLLKVTDVDGKKTKSFPSRKLHHDNLQSINLLIKLSLSRGNKTYTKTLETNLTNLEQFGTYCRQRREGNKDKSEVGEADLRQFAAPQDDLKNAKAALQQAEKDLQEAEALFEAEFGQSMMSIIREAEASVKVLEQDLENSRIKTKGWRAFARLCRNRRGMLLEQGKKLAGRVLADKLNASQTEAVRNGLKSGTSIIHGPPGTGKTKTISCLARTLLSVLHPEFRAAGGRYPHRVILTAASNKAVFNGMERIISDLQKEAVNNVDPEASSSSSAPAQQADHQTPAALAPTFHLPSLANTVSAASSSAAAAPEKLLPQSSLKNSTALSASIVGDPAPDDRVLIYGVEDKVPPHLDRYFVHSRYKLVFNDASVTLPEVQRLCREAPLWASNHKVMAMLSHPTTDAGWNKFLELRQTEGGFGSKGKGGKGGNGDSKAVTLGAFLKLDPGQVKNSLEAELLRRALYIGSTLACLGRGEFIGGLFPSGGHSDALNAKKMALNALWDKGGLMRSLEAQPQFAIEVEKKLLMVTEDEAQEVAQAQAAATATSAGSSCEDVVVPMTLDADAATAASPTQEQDQKALANRIVSFLSARVSERGGPETSIILDEGAQATEAETLNAIALNPKRLILVGDHKQLSATVIRCTENQKAKYARSLQERLSITTPGFGGLFGGGQQTATSCRPIPATLLDTQYRMHPTIAQWPNMMFYEGKLANGACTEVPATENRCVPWSRLLQARSCPGPDRGPNRNYPRGVDASALQNPRLKAARILLVHHSGREERDHEGASCHNPTEAELVARALQFFDRSGWTDANDPDKNAVAITFYKAQEMRLTRNTNMRQVGAHVHTVDSFQGSEASVVLLSFVRSGLKTGFLEAAERLNVALTRAKDLLVVFANVEGLLGLKRGALDKWGRGEQASQMGQQMDPTGSLKLPNGLETTTSGSGDGSAQGDKKMVSMLLNDLLRRAKQGEGSEVALVSAEEWENIVRGSGRKSSRDTGGFSRDSFWQADRWAGAKGMPNNFYPQHRGKGMSNYPQNRTPGGWFNAAALAAPRERSRNRSSQPRINNYDHNLRGGEQDRQGGLRSDPPAQVASDNNSLRDENQRNDPLDVEIERPYEHRHAGLSNNVGRDQDLRRHGGNSGMNNAGRGSDRDFRAHRSYDDQRSHNDGRDDLRRDNRGRDRHRDDRRDDNRDDRDRRHDNRKNRRDSRDDRRRSRSRNYRHGGRNHRDHDRGGSSGYGRGGRK